MFNITRIKNTNYLLRSLWMCMLLAEPAVQNVNGTHYCDASSDYCTLYN